MLKTKNNLLTAAQMVSKLVLDGATNDKNNQAMSMNAMFVGITHPADGQCRSNSNFSSANWIDRPTAS